METIKAILERRIKGAEYLIAEIESKIASEELYRNKRLIRKEAFENILEEWNELQKYNANIALAKEAMNTHVHVNVENLHNSIITETLPEIKKIESGDIAPIKTNIFKEELKNRVKEAGKIFSEIEPFKEVPAFTYRQTDLLKQVGKNSVFCINHDGIIAIWRAQYKINIFTTTEEIQRMKSLPEMAVKLTLQDYGKRTYPNKAVVLRHFLRDLKDVNELKVNPVKSKVIPTFSTLKEVDEIKKA